VIDRDPAAALGQFVAAALPESVVRGAERRALDTVAVALAPLREEP
jgi:hypothetical protein